MYPIALIRHNLDPHLKYTFLSEGEGGILYPSEKDNKNQDKVFTHYIPTIHTYIPCH